MCIIIIIIIIITIIVIISTSTIIIIIMDRTALSEPHSVTQNIQPDLSFVIVALFHFTTV
jgi:hypothetical protein